AAVRSPGAVVAIYAAPLGAIALSCLVIFGGARARALNERLGRFGRRLTGAVRRRPLAGRA
ncbi:LPS export ABC transporter permease LptF, partial [Methylorubrum rhodesianum]